MKSVQIHLASASTPIAFENAVNTWTQGGMFCIRVVGESGDVADHKFPLVNIFEVVETA